MALVELNTMVSHIMVMVSHRTVTINQKLFTMSNPFDIYSLHPIKDVLCTLLHKLRLLKEILIKRKDKV